MLISYWKVSIPFLDDAKLTTNLSFYAYLNIVEKLKGGSDEVEILVACN